MKLPAVLLCALLTPSLVIAATPPDTSLFEQANLAAWCIVPFDAKKRGPEERAAMLEKLGFSKFVYDYRKEHVPTFDAEMEALQKHHIELLGWWFPSSLNDEAKLILDVIKRHGMRKCDLWVTGGGQPTATREEKAERVQQEVARIKPIALEAAKLGVRVGLYNHGNWFGEPANMVAMAEAFKKEGITNVGIVYNLHHGHADLPHFSELLHLMLPYLICLNLDGMTAGGDAKGQMILPLAQGDRDLTLLKEIATSGYHGPIGILNHTDEDAEGRLQDNLDGLKWLVKQLEHDDAGPRPVPKTWKPVAESSKSPSPNSKSPIDNPMLVPSLSPAFGKALSGGLVVEGKAGYRTLPVSIECRARLDNAKGYNILLACDPKASSQHWELYTHAGSGFISLYLPGHGGDFKSSLNVCDGQWHDFVANVGTEKLKLFVDNKVVLEAAIQPEKGKSQPGGLAFGRLVEGGLGCAGLVDDVRITPGSVAARNTDQPRQKMDVSVGYWNFDEESVLQSSATQGAGPSAPAPAKLTYDRAPLHPELWPHWQEFVNRDRFYDFYAKEAEQFKKQQPLPELLPQYQGLDSGKYGHWGNQDDVLWTDGRWNDTNLGSVMCGIFHGGGATVLKGVCICLGGKEDVSACFDPMTLRFAKVWSGGFVHFDPHRHGFMNGVIMSGTPVTRKLPEPATEPFIYHGFYRHGTDVIFAYQRDGKEYLTSAMLDEGGHFVEVTAPKNESLMRDQSQGGPTQWPQWFPAKGILGTHKPYAIDTLPLPVDNPWKTLFFVSGQDFFSNGDAAICTMTGEVWLCRGIDEGLQHLRWKRYATGLHQPLGLKIVDDKVCILGRDQITRLHDLNGDDEADFYECVSNAQITSASGHDFITGLERDKEGRFYFASGNQGVSRVKPGGPVEVLATGFRNPNGLGLSEDGKFLTGSVQEGDWTPASAVCQIPLDGKEHYFGHGGPQPGKVIEPPLVYLPRGEDNSCGGQCFTKSEKWGPLGGQLIHFSSGAASHFLILREKIGDQWQGAAVVLPGDFLSGLQQGRIRPQDGQLYVSGLFGWGTYAPADGCFQRVRYTGGPAHLPVSLATHENGVLMKFSDPLDPYVAEQITSHFAQCWNYHYAASYGSPELSLRWPSQPGHDVLPIRSAHVLEDGHSLFLEIPLLTPANEVHLHVTPAPGVTQDVFLTIHRMREPFTNFPGYKPEPKQQIVALQTAASAFAVVPAKPNPWAKGEPGREIKVEAALGLQFAQKTLEMHPGEHVSLTFKNPDVVPHNWVLLQPGKLQSIGDAANKMITDPQGLARHYVPDSPDVLVYTDMTNPGNTFTIHFTAPDKLGDYPYMCTFPGHWVVMNGVAHVTR